MNYLVLARKYRPVNFEEVVGQEHVTKILIGAIRSNRLAHAFCFTGPRGVGKTSVARILAKVLNCKDGINISPCDQCYRCKEINESRSIDVQEIDAASNSRVENIRELREIIRYQPQSYRYRIIILDEVHMLSKSAFNALLKVLEEPPDHVIFILATTDVHKIPLTVLSRCQRYDFRRISFKDIIKHLEEVLKQEKRSLSYKILSLIAKESDGSIRDALSLLDQILSLNFKTISYQEVVDLLGLIDRELIDEAVDAIISRNSKKLLKIINDFYENGGEIYSLYHLLLEQFRNLIVVSSVGTENISWDLTSEEVEELKVKTKNISSETLFEIFNLLIEVEKDFRQTSQPRIVLEMTLLKIIQLEPVLNLDKIIEELKKGIDIEKKNI